MLYWLHMCPSFGVGDKMAEGGILESDVYICRAFALVGEANISLVRSWRYSVSG